LAWHDLPEGIDAPRFLPIGLIGVWNWRGRTGKTVGPEGDRRDQKGPIGDLDRIGWKVRPVTITFDRDLEEKEGVQAARTMLTLELQKRGATVKWFTWPKDAPHAKGVDDLLSAIGPHKVLELIERAHVAKPTSADQRSTAREFLAVSDDRYRLTLPGIGVEFEIDRLRRDHHELLGELAVRCDLPGARTVDRCLSIADFNVSSARARSERAKLLADRARTNDLDWPSLIEEFCHRVLAADRAGQPAVDLRQLERPERDDIEVEGLALPRRHPTILFGDGGSVKSYTALWLSGRMVEGGMKVGLFDWELAGEDHRDRLERLFGPQMPRITYARCERPLIFEADRLRRIVRENGIEFAVFDSIAFACDGPPESAEVAGRYFRAVRQIGVGSLHVAHVSKAEGADKKPFGSAFWHNGARSTWYAQLADGLADSDVLNVGLFHRKANLSRLRSAVGFTITFTEDGTTFRRTEVADSPDLAGQLSVRQKMAYLLRKGAMTPESVADEIEADLETVKRTARRYKKFFTVIDGGRLALLERTA